MRCVFCGEEFGAEDVGTGVDAKKAVSLGKKIICVNCLRSLSILLKEVEISAKEKKLMSDA